MTELFEPVATAANAFPLDALAVNDRFRLFHFTTRDDSQVVARNAVASAVDAVGLAQPLQAGSRPNFRSSAGSTSRNRQTRTACSSTPYRRCTSPNPQMTTSPTALHLPVDASQFVLST